MAVDVVASFRQALAGAPQDPGAWNDLGVALKRLDRSVEATAAFRRALRLDPLRAEAHVNLGNELRSGKRPAAALGAHLRAALLMPAIAGAYNNIGSALPQELPIAAALYRRALCIRRDYTLAYFNMASTLTATGRPVPARDALRRALALTPDHVGALNNLAIQLRDGGDIGEATAVQRRSLRVDPDNPESRLNLAQLLLLQGVFAEGFDAYEWRWRGAALAPTRQAFDRPQWRGEPGNGRTLLLWAEQGLGDTLQFVRYVPMARALGWRVVLQVPAALRRLLATLDPEVRMLDDGGKLPSFDAHSPLLSLPRLLGTTVATIPASAPYLRAEDRRRAEWRGRLPRDGYRVGIVWQGNPAGGIDRGRSYPLACAAPLARVPGVRLISLQRLHGLDQLGRLPPDMTVETLGDDLDAGGDAFLDTAAVAMELDLIVTSDTAVAHLAGALGRPIWLVLRATPDWRWLLGRDDSPWYPTMRLFRQAAPGDWHGVFVRVADELAAVVAGDTDRLLPPAAAPALAPICVEVSPGELLDKITVLQIKQERIADPAKLRNVAAEHALLAAAADRFLPRSPGLATLVARLRSVNERLWQIENDIRDCEGAADFGDRFIALARSVYRRNDERAAVKRAINTLLNSRLMEEKSYDSGPHCRDG